MNGSWKGLALAAAVAAATPAWVSAQEQAVERGSVNRITTLIKSEVVLREGEPAGKIVDFVISNQGCIEYLVAESDEGYYVVPFAAARVDFQAHSVRLAVTQREFRDVVYFKSSNWPNLSDRAYQQRLYKFWGVQAARGSNTPEERTTNKPIPRDRDRDRDRDDRDREGERGRDRDRDRDPDRNGDGRPEARGDNSPRDPNTPRDRDPKSPPTREPRNPKVNPPAPGTQPRDPAPRPNPDAGPKPRPRTDVPPKPPAPSGNSGNEESKKPRGDKP